MAGDTLYRTALKRPTTRFTDWLRVQARDEFLKDVNLLAGYLHYASTPKKNALDPDVRMELTCALINKINQRDEARSKGDFHRWDGRNWRGVEPIRKRLAASYAK